MPVEELIRNQIGRLYNYFQYKGYANTTGGGVTFLADNDKLYYIPTDILSRCNSAGEETRFLPNSVVQKETLSNCKLTDICAPLIAFPFTDLGAKALAHSHSANSIICSMMDHCTIPPKFQMSKNIFNLRENRFLRAYEQIKVPIIDESEINDVIGESCAFLVRGHGLYVWSTTRHSAVLQLDTYETMFEIIVKTAGE